jgi:hypothetical protein
MVQPLRENLNLELVILQERLRQARYSFNLALFSTTACGMIGLVGVVVICRGKVPEGSFLATGGLTPIAACLKFARDANDRLDQIFAEIQDNKQAD